ncbi:MBL fold metallo-hydrolase [Arthrobacter sp. FW306-04-A]|uniref:MBL fold metallo-hydrolase n=1 Tax=Arthrobacter sp. FW306-04-A TaxID=2879619 RepID=UPI0037BEAFD6|nr:MBL fold metallo-hydrolase [Arthrobacter sp. FW306-04-A]
MRPASAKQYAQHLNGGIPDPEEFRPGIWSFAIPFLPGVPYTLCYVVEDSAKGFHVIDPGADTPSNRDRLKLNLLSIGAGLDDIRSVAVTHLHRDHLGLAAWLIDQNDLAIQLHIDDQEDLISGASNARYSDDLEALGLRWGVPENERKRLHTGGGTAGASPIPARIRPLDDSEVLPIPGRTVRVLHTPGHTRGHVCFSLPDEGLLLSGDHVLPHLNPGIGRGGPGGENPVGEYLLSLERLAQYDDGETAPGHGYRFFDLGARRTRIRDHVLRRAGEVTQALKSTPQATTWGLASSLSWGGGWTNLSATRLQSALAQTEMYVEFVGALPMGLHLP